MLAQMTQAHRQVVVLSDFQVESWKELDESGRRRVARLLSPDSLPNPKIERVRADEKNFRFQLNEDAMADNRVIRVAGHVERITKEFVWNCA